MPRAGFDSWILQVDGELHSLAAISSWCFSNFDFRAAWERGQKPGSAARKALRGDGWDGPDLSASRPMPAMKVSGRGGAHRQGRRRAG